MHAGDDFKGSEDSVENNEAMIESESGKLFKKC
jgi:hypothetical protein